MKDQTPAPDGPPDDPAFMFILAIPSRMVRPVFDHLGTLPPDILRTVRVAGCDLDRAAPAPDATPDLFAEDRADG